MKKKTIRIAVTVDEKGNASACVISRDVPEDEALGITDECVDGASHLQYIFEAEVELPEAVRVPAKVEVVAKPAS